MIRWVALAVSVVTLLCASSASAQIAPRMTPSRVSGAAPLAVFFDANGTTCAGCDAVDTWHDLGYQWDFGDVGAGAWNLSTRSRMTDVGPSAAHVFESAGVYTVRLSVVDPATGMMATVTQ